MKPTKELIQRHKPMTKKQVTEHFEIMREMKKNITTDAVVLEQNLAKFNEIEDPLFDPETKQPLCWIRRPTQSEFEAMIPVDMLEYRDSLDAVPEDIKKKYQNFQFEMMANLITKPKHDVQWWKEHSNLVFQQLFQLHLSGILEDLGISAENF